MLRKFAYKVLILPSSFSILPRFVISQVIDRLDYWTSLVHSIKSEYMTIYINGITLYLHASGLILFMQANGFLCYVW